MKKKWIKWSFWPILIVFVILGYFYTKSKEKNQHLKYIPSSAKVVMMIDSKKIANDYYKLLRYDPTAIDKVLEGEETEGAPIEDFELPGTVPFEKMAVYIYQDSVAENQFFKCMIATISDKQQFIRANNPQKEKVEKIEREGGEIYHLKDDNKLLLIKDGIGLVIEPVLPAFEMDQSIGERHFDEVFVNQNPLVKSEGSFADFVDEHDHLGVWTGEERKNKNALVDNLMPTNRLFNSQTVAINLLPEVIDIKSNLYVENKDFFIEAGSKEIPLGDDDYIKMSMSLNPDFFKDMFEGVIPDANQQLLDVWTGKLAMTVVGFRKTPVQEYKFNEDAQKVDALELETFVNLPDVALTAEITSVKEIIDFFNSDSTAFIQIENGYKYLLPNLVDEYVYVYPSDDAITIATKELKVLPEPIYTTFAFSVNIEKLFAEYPPKDMIQTILLPSLNKFSFKKFEMHYDGMTDDYLIIHGGLKMGEEGQNTLLQIIPVIYNLMINF